MAATLMKTIEQKLSVSVTANGILNFWFRRGNFFFWCTTDQDNPLTLYPISPAPRTTWLIFDPKKILQSHCIVYGDTLDGDWLTRTIAFCHRMSSCPSGFAAPDRWKTTGEFTSARLPALGVAQQKHNGLQPSHLAPSDLEVVI